MTIQTAWQSVCTFVLVSKCVCLLTQLPSAACVNEVMQEGQLGQACSSHVVATLASLAPLSAVIPMQSGVSLGLAGVSEPGSQPQPSNGDSYFVIPLTTAATSVPLRQ